MVVVVVVVVTYETDVGFADGATYLSVAWPGLAWSDLT